MVNAMKSKDTETLSLLRVVAGEFGRKMNNGIELNDNQVITILRRMKRDAKVMGNHGEVKILDKYIPEMLDESQIKTIVSGIIQMNKYSGMKDMGKVMGTLTTHPMAIQIDGNISSRITRELLTK